MGAALLEWFGFRSALLIQAALLFVILLSGWLLPADMGKIGKKVPFRQLFSKSKEINILSAARFFLFGSRDVWFVVALPVFLYEVLGWRFMQVGSYMALWVIGYGIVQFLAPQLLRKDASGQVVPKAKTIVFDLHPHRYSRPDCPHVDVWSTGRHCRDRGAGGFRHCVCLQLGGAFLPGIGLHRR